MNVKPKHQISPERLEMLKDITKRKDKDAMIKFVADETKIKEEENVKADIEILNHPEQPQIKPTPSLEPILRKLSAPEDRKPPREPKIRIRTSSNEKSVQNTSKVILKPTGEQIHLLVHSVVQGATTLLNKEDITKEEDRPFSEVLYDIGDQLKWWDSIEILPYLILVFSGIDLGLTIMKKPTKQKHQNKVIEEKIVAEIERVPTPAHERKYDMVNEEALMQKLGGNNIYATTTTEEIE